MAKLDLKQVIETGEWLVRVRQSQNFQELFTEDSESFASLREASPEVGEYIDSLRKASSLAYSALQELTKIGEEKLEAMRVVLRARYNDFRIADGIGRPHIARQMATFYSSPYTNMGDNLKVAARVLFAYAAIMPWVDKAREHETLGSLAEILKAKEAGERK